MGFRKSRLTALLAASAFLFASTVLTTKVSAQEKVSGLCSVASFSVTDKSCGLIKVKKQNSLKSSEFLPSISLLPTVAPEAVKEIKKEEVKVAIKPEVNYLPSPQATLSADLLFELVNKHRASINLPSFEKEQQICSVAQSRREGIANEIFNSLPMHSGFYAMNLPYWATENMIYQHTEQEALNWWLNSSIHRSAIEGNYKYACGVCNGEVCNMVFTNYEPKVAFANNVVENQTSQTATATLTPNITLSPASIATAVK